MYEENVRSAPENEADMYISYDRYIGQVYFILRNI